MAHKVKLTEIAKAVSIIAEVDDSRIETRHSQGWISQVAETVEEAMKLALDAQEKMKQHQLPIMVILLTCLNML